MTEPARYVPPPPNLSDRLFGASMPDNPEDVDIEGWVVSLAMSDIKVFGAYKPNTFMLGSCLQTAESIWNCVQSIRQGTMTLDDVECHKGFHPLCDWCDFNADCPKYCSMEAWNAPEAEQELERLAAFKTEDKALKAQIKELEKRVMQTYATLNPNGAWITAGEHRFRATIQPGRENIDKDALTNELFISWKEMRSVWPASCEMSLGPVRATSASGSVPYAGASNLLITPRNK